MKKGVHNMFNRRYFKENGQLKLKTVILDVLIVAVIYFVFSLLFGEHKVVQAIIELLLYIYIASLTIILLAMDMVSETRKVNKQLNNKKYGFKFFEKSYPTSLFKNLYEGYYSSPNSEFFSKIVARLSKFNDDELNQTIWEIQYHLEKDKPIKPLVELFGLLVTIVGLKEILQKYVFGNFNNLIAWLLTAVLLCLLFLYYIQITLKKRGFLKLLESIVIDEKEKREEK